MTGTMVLNACGTVLGPVSWQHAVSLVVTGKAIVHEADPKRMIRSKTTEVPFPRVIRLVKWVYVKFTGKKNSGGSFTKKAVLERDKYTCIYCGGHGNTIDHIEPESRGGKLTWENCAAACAPCNSKKANRTPEEAGMRLRWEPWRPDFVGMMQRDVWATL